MLILQTVRDNRHFMAKTMENWADKFIESALDVSVDKVDKKWYFDVNFRVTLRLQPYNKIVIIFLLTRSVLLHFTRSHHISSTVNMYHHCHGKKSTKRSFRVNAR